LFLSDLFGQLELLTFFSKKASYCKTAKTFKPLFPKRYRTLFQLFPNQIGLVKYYKTLLVKLYQIKPWLYNKKITPSQLPVIKENNIGSIFPLNGLASQPGDLVVYSLKMQNLLFSSSLKS
jgi:hypothetical protein